jgi:CRP/FNR family transcriptional regulator
MPSKRTSKIASPATGPALHAAALWAADRLPEGTRRQLLSREQRAKLLAIGSLVRFGKGEQLYRAGDPADALYNIISGVVKSFSRAPDGNEYINAFLVPHDLFGLASEGRYSNCAEAITAVTAWRLPVSKLQAHLHRDAELEFHVICKLCQDLRQTQRHAFLVARKDAVPKIAMFLRLMEELQADRGEPINEIYLPMDRTEIGEYVGLSLEAVSRAFRMLSSAGVVKARDRRHVKITDQQAFNALIALPSDRAAN